jgi:malonyl-CoA O-methyltransferase
VNKTIRISSQGLALHCWASSNSAGLPIVLIHGWGNDSRCWQPLLPDLLQLGPVIAVDLPGFGESPPLPVFNEGALLDALAEILPEKCRLLGWSLGGMLAVVLAGRFPQRVQQLITLAANLKFVADADWPQAMAPEVNQAFNEAFAANPDLTRKRFTNLMVQGDEQERALLKNLRQQIPVMDSGAAQQALALLAELDNRESFARLQVPGLHLLAEQDALVPAAVAPAMQALNASQQLIVLAGAAHALTWSCPQKVVEQIQRFLPTMPKTARSKQRIADAFSRAASSYDSVAKLQRDVADALLATLPSFDHATLLDLGCGTGYCLPALQQQANNSNLLAADLAFGMLQFARQQRAVNAGWVAADAENLPFADNTIDLVVSSLALQWCEQPQQLFSELRRVLPAGGRLHFSTLGPATLKELRAAWASVDDYVHVNDFPDQALLRTALQQAGFAIDGWTTEIRTLTYPSVVELSRGLKALGAHNSNAGQPRGLTGRQALRQLEAAYETFRKDELLPATYEVFYISAIAD